jgi:beta,beta-carotene 9',10'-dioxygenase
VDVLVYPDPRVIEDLRLSLLRAGPAVDPTATLTRFRVPLTRKNGAELVAADEEVLCSTRFELPRIDYTRRASREYECVWGAGQTKPGNFLDNITKIQITRGNGVTIRKWEEPGCDPGEPVFVPRPGGHDQDDGVLLSVVLDTTSQRSFLLVLDAADLAEQARAPAPTIYLLVSTAITSPTRTTPIC